MRCVYAAFVVLAAASCAGAPPLRGPAGVYTLVDARAAESAVAARAVEACAIVHVDGFDNTLDDARGNFDAISSAYAKAGGPCHEYGFAWRSDHGLLGLRAAEREADTNAGAALADFLDALEATYGADAIQVTAHSLGARVVLRALAQRAGAGRALLGAVALVAPAVATEDVRPGGALWDGVAGARRIAVFHNTKDRILRFLYPLFSGGRAALGAAGVPDLAAATALASRRGVRLVDVDCAPLWGSHHVARASFDARFWALYEVL